MKRCLYNTTSFTGQEYDEKAGLVYMNARWYNSNIGRFMSQDAYPGNPLNPQSLNQYAYVMNNPVNMWDPTGNIPSWVGQSSYKEYEKLLDDEYLMEEYNISSNTSSTGWKQISYTEELKRYVYKYRNRVTTHWRYEHIHHRWQLVPHPVTGKVAGAVEIGTTTETAHYEVIDYYYKTVIKSALDIAMENQIEVDKKIREALEGQNIPENEDPTISISRLDGQVIDGEDVILNQDSTTEEDRLVLSHVKSQLNEILGTNVNPNGSYNGTTKGLVKNFQEANDLLPTGVIDKKTFLQIDKAYDYLSMSDDTRQVAAPEAIEGTLGLNSYDKLSNKTIDSEGTSQPINDSFVQQYLVNLGFDIGSSGENKDGVDGDFGAKSSAALDIFHAWAGIANKDSYDEETILLLEEAFKSGISYSEIVNELTNDLHLQNPLSNFRISSHFGYREDPENPGSGIMEGHKGTDFAAPMGTEITAAIGGTVIHRGTYGTGGVAVIIESKLDNGLTIRTEYFHMVEGSYGDFAVGDKVSQGQYIGKVGSTGRSTGPHLHFGVIIMNGNTRMWVDPLKYLNIE